LRDGLLGRFQLDVGIIISDTFGRPWRRGLTDVAIGSAGVLPILDLRGSPDTFGREMQVTEVALVDELASAAELVMGKSTGIPIAIVRGGDESWFGNGSVQDHIVRDPKEDLFR
jgi:coenzyme F420-0:L-glutamate ligase/coenzyme F420-1:gamma-L-glutamate ligase